MRAYFVTQCLQGSRKVLNWIVVERVEGLTDFTSNGQRETVRFVALLC
jgi:hypothetical protein